MTGHSRSSATPVAAALFFEALRASRLLSEEQLGRLPLAETDPMADGCRLADRLVEEGLLTDYQAGRLLDGRADGLVLGSYRLLRPLGAGGMGHVYLAEHTLLQRRVALKVLAEHLLFDEAAVARFRWEFQVAAQLHHPNIVATHDAGECDGRHYLVMEYVDGPDLGRLVRERGPLPVPLACECVRQAAMGLQHAYSAGFVHCDVKPANFLLTRNAAPGDAAEWVAASPLFTPHSEFRTLKIVDLGLARRWETPDGDKAGAACEDLAGSIDYLAPEKALDPHHIDIRSDLYGLGCTLYYLLAGQAPFPGGAWPDKLLRHQLDQATPIRILRADVPAEVEAVVTRLMAKAPADRFALPAEVAVVLHEWLAAHREAPVRPRAAPPSRGAATKTPVSLDTDTLPMFPPMPSSEPGVLSTQYSVLSTQYSGARREPRPPEPNLSASVARAKGAMLSRPTPGLVHRSGPDGGRESMPRRVRWTTLAGAALFLVLSGAVLLHLLPWGRPRPVPPVLSAVSPVARAGSVRHAASITLASRPGVAFATLKLAVEAAQNGDTLSLADEVYSTGPLAVRGKALTLRAAPGTRPRVRLTQAASSWQPLFTTDRALVLEGLELLVADAATSRAAGTTHLIYAEGAALRLSDCRLLGAEQAGLVVARRAPSLVLERCELVARASPVLVEVGPEAVELRVTACRLRTTEERGPALTVWCSEDTRPASLRVELTGSTVEAGRVAAFTGLLQAVEVTARDNVFHFREALLSYAGCGPDWRQATRWQGQANRYLGLGDWLLVEGRPTGVRGLDQWRDLWQDGEPESVEETGPVVGRSPD